MPSHHSFSNIAIAILDFSLLLLGKLSLLILFTYFSLTPLRATTIAVAIVGRAITIWEAKQKRSESTKIEAKRLRATNMLSQSWESDN